MRREHNTTYRHTFNANIDDDGSNPLNNIVDVGEANEYLSFVQDQLCEGSLADLDPLNQFIMLEEMEEYEALLLVLDIYRKSH